ncbi:MAG: PIN domain-containing protein [Allorhizobium sp.]
MIGVDTNILLRLIVVDDPEQNEKARHFLSQRSIEDPAYISAMVVAELVWFLRRRLNYQQSQIMDLLQSFLASNDVVVEYAEELGLLLSDETAPIADLADNLIAWAGMKAGCRKVVTFDRRAAKLIPGMELLA